MRNEYIFDDEEIYGKILPRFINARYSSGIKIGSQYGKEIETIQISQLGNTFICNIKLFEHSYISDNFIDLIKTSEANYRLVHIKGSKYDWHLSVDLFSI